MKHIKFLVLFFSMSVLIGCSSDSGGGIDLSAVTITTTAPTFDSANLNISTGGKLSSDFSGSADYQVGICYGNMPNPGIADQIMEVGNASQNLEFSARIYSVIFGNTYYIRAFVRNNITGEVKYGNEVSLLIPIALATGSAKNISCSGFSIDVTVPASLASNDRRGICFSTSQNPTIDNSVFEDATDGAGPFTAQVENPVANYYIQAGTTYYVRSFVRVQGTYYYGNQVSFKAAGYIGGSGGYVFFDKGEATNGWRYLEAASDVLVYNNNVNWHFTWNNCNAVTFLSGISNDIGAGAENTTILRANCNFTDNAATMARYIEVNGMTDWFLPSIDELKMLYTLKKENIISYNSNAYPLISSSQMSNNSGFAVDFSTGNTIGILKSQGSRVWQVRRF